MGFLGTTRWCLLIALAGKIEMLIQENSREDEGGWIAQLTVGAEGLRPCLGMCLLSV